ncbi:methyl-accepting chemotaxis protein [Psychromonas hadalis]|uniref:methyl-accepting chemotaxis protein n=1 Tax=Psychromonas hadalis TaxID=211669 RepID=UPI0003B309E0|nr:methyl-accepting chemotaxis protein [Psychromonas hadalis]
MSFKGKIFSLLAFIVVLAIFTSYLSANYYINSYIFNTSVKNTTSQLDLVNDKLSGDIKHKILLAKNIDTGSASLEDLQQASGFYRINKVLQGMLFTEHGTENDPAKKDPILKMLKQAGQKISVSDIFTEQQKTLITLTIPGKNGRGNIFFIDLTEIQTLLANSTTKGSYFELSDARQQLIFSNKVEGDLLKVEHQVEVGNTFWHLTGYIDKAYIEEQTSTLNQSITFALLVAGVVLLVLGIFLVRIAYQPIEQLRLVVTDLASGEGDLTRRLEVKSNDDLGLIASGINRFTENLQELMLGVAKTTDNLESRVEQISDNALLNHGLLDSHAKETEQAVSAITEMSATADSVAQSALSASQLTEDSSQQADTCKTLVRNSVSSIEALISDVDEMSTSIFTLNDDIAKIGSVLGVIGGIAEQTNLLALNAAIEAARAGEQGRGFAVVADEVRSLASRTQDSTKEINTMLLKLQSGTTSVVAAMENTKLACQASAEAIQESTLSLDIMSGSIAEINTLNMQIAAAAEQQSVTTNEISRNMTMIQDMVNELEKNGTETIASVDEIKKSKSQLVEVVEHFKLS